MNISDKYKLIFFHLPKCAGKSIISALDIKTNDETNLKSGLRQTTAMGYDTVYWNKLIYPEKWKTYTKFTIVRNPWDRVVSIYHFRKKENDLYKLFPPVLGTNIKGGDKLGPDGKEWEFKRWLLSGYSKGFTDIKLKKSASYVELAEVINNIEKLHDKNTKYISDELMSEFMDADSKTLDEAIERHEWFIPNIVETTGLTKYTAMVMDKKERQITTTSGTETVNHMFQLIRDRLEWFNNIDLISDMNGNLSVDNILRFEHLEEDWNMMFEVEGYEPPKLPKKNVSKHKHYSEYYDDETREFVTQLFERDIKTFGYTFGE